jgi:hypothetical protein
VAHACNIVVPCGTLTFLLLIWSSICGLLSEPSISRTIVLICNPCNFGLWDLLIEGLGEQRPSILEEQRQQQSLTFLLQQKNISSERKKYFHQFLLVATKIVIYLSLFN